MEDDIAWWAFDEVEAFMRSGFEAIGVPPEEAAVCADVLVSADKRGVDSHGVGRYQADLPRQDMGRHAEAR